MTTVHDGVGAELQDALGRRQRPHRPRRHRRPTPATRRCSRRPGTPAAVVLPRSTAEVVAVMQVASRHGVPVVPARRRLRAGRRRSNAVDGAITLVLTRMDAVLEVAAGRPARRRPARRGEQDAARRRRRARAVLSAGPVQLRLVHDRRQPLHQLRRAVLRQVRRHHRLRARPGGRARRRAGAAHRPAHGQGRRRLRPGPAVRRLGGHPRRHHRGDAGAAPRAAARRSPWPPPSRRRRRPARSSSGW